RIRAESAPWPRKIRAVSTAALWPATNSRTSVAHRRRWLHCRALIVSRIESRFNPLQILRVRGMDLPRTRTASRSDHLRGVLAEQRLHPREHLLVGAQPSPWHDGSMSDGIQGSADVGFSVVTGSVTASALLKVLHPVAPHIWITDYTPHSRFGWES